MKSKVTKKEVKLTNNKNYKKITKTMTLGEVLENYPGADKVFMGFGMHCFSCPMSQMESIEEASIIHGIDLDLMLKKLNELNK